MEARKDVLTPHDDVLGRIHTREISTYADDEKQYPDRPVLRIRHNNAFMTSVFFLSDNLLTM